MIEPAATMRYAGRSLAGDYLRGGIGSVLAGAMWVALPAAVYVDVVFGGLTLLFALFTIRTAWRQLLRFALLPDGLAQLWPRRRVLLWDRLDSLRLRYYSTRRNREGGWMTLTMRADGMRMSFESTLEGFDAMVQRAALAARQRDVPLDDPTRANLGALGIEGYDPMPAPPVPPARWRFGERARRDGQDRDGRNRDDRNRDDRNKVS